jgi:hypothetical protein
MGCGDSGWPRSSAGAHGLALGGGSGHHAGPDGRAVEVDGAGATLAEAAAEFGAAETELGAQDPQQGGIVFDVDMAGFAVDRQLEHGDSEWVCTG